MRAYRSFVAFMGVIAIAGVCYAAQAVSLVSDIKMFKPGIYVGNTSTSTSNILKRSLSNSATYDAASITATCTESSAITVTGALAGDPCNVGVPAAVGALNVSVSCYVSAADAVKVKVCNPTSGAIDAASGTYYVRVTSSQ